MKERRLDCCKKRDASVVRWRLVTRALGYDADALGYGDKAVRTFGKHGDGIALAMVSILSGSRVSIQGVLVKVEGAGWMPDSSEDRAPDAGVRATAWSQRAGSGVAIRGCCRWMCAGAFSPRRAVEERGVVAGGDEVVVVVVVEIRSEPDHSPPERVTQLAGLTLVSAAGCRLSSYHLLQNTENINEIVRRKLKSQVKN